MLYCNVGILLPSSKSLPGKIHLDVRSSLTPVRKLNLVKYIYTTPYLFIYSGNSRL